MYYKSLLAVAITLAATQSGIAQASVAEALEDGKMLADFRLRYETNDTDGGTKAAEAITLRSRLGYESGVYNGFKVLIENEMVHAFQDEYAALTPGFDPVADPTGNEINRAQISYAKDDFAAVVGRQRIILDNVLWVTLAGARMNKPTMPSNWITKPVIYP